MYSLKKVGGHYSLEPTATLTIDLGRGGIHAINLTSSANVQRLADNFVVDHKLDYEAKNVILLLLKEHQRKLTMKWSDDKENTREDTEDRQQTERSRTPLHPTNELHYNKFKEKITTQKVRKSLTPVKTAQLPENTYDPMKSTRVIVKTLDLSNSKAIKKKLEELFHSLNKRSHNKRKLDIDGISFEGLDEKLLEVLHRFFSRLTQRQIASLTLDNFQQLAWKHGLVSSLLKLSNQ